MEGLFNSSPTDCRIQVHNGELAFVDVKTRKIVPDYDGYLDAADAASWILKYDVASYCERTLFQTCYRINVVGFSTQAISRICSAMNANIGTRAFYNHVRQYYFAS